MMCENFLSYTSPEKQSNQWNGQTNKTILQQIHISKQKKKKKRLITHPYNKKCELILIYIGEKKIVR